MHVAFVNKAGAGDMGKRLRTQLRFDVSMLPSAADCGSTKKLPDHNVDACGICKRGCVFLTSIFLEWLSENIVLTSVSSRCVWNGLQRTSCMDKLVEGVADGDVLKNVFNSAHFIKGAVTKLSQTTSVMECGNTVSGAMTRFDTMRCTAAIWCIHAAECC